MQRVRSLQSIISALQAIVFREVKSRYSKNSFGYLWAYATPLAWVAVIYAGFIIIGRSTPIDTDIFSFILAGIMPYMAFRFTISAMIRARSSYRHIMEIMYEDRRLVYVGVTIVETYNMLLLYAVFLTVNYAVFNAFEVNDLLVGLTGMLLACGLGAAIGFVVVEYSDKSETLIRLIPVILRPSFYLSGVFFTANELPTAIALALAWNPLFHIVEFTRSGMFLAYDSVLAFATFPLVLIVLITALGVKRPRFRS